MSKTNLEKFKNKFQLSDTLISNISTFIDRLIKYGYISVFKKNALISKLIDNINEIYVGTNDRYDYKTGFYDANKKTLYIKNEKDIPALFLRLLYAITTTQLEKESYISGYMITRLSTKSYKLMHENFGINRAVMANLVCNLCNELPDNMRLVPSYHNYTHNFLGYKIVSSNDIYSLEGKILNELCYALDIDENVFYAGIFSLNPTKYLESIFEKKGFSLKDKFFKLWDELSRKYSHYCKLAYLSKELNKNYLEFKKTMLDTSILESLTFQKECIENEIKKVLYKIQKESTKGMDVIEDDFNITDTAASLNETLSNYETELLDILVSMQTILAKKILLKPNYISDYEYTSRLMQFNSLLIIPNKEIKKTITNTILNKLMPRDELTGINLTVKIKYCLITSILTQSQLTNVSKLINFSIIEPLAFAQDGTVLALMYVNNVFNKLVQINSLDERLEKMQTPPEFIPIDSIAHIINSDYTNMYVGNLEKIYTALKFKYKDFVNLSLNNVYVFEYLNQSYLITVLNSKCQVFHYTTFKDTIDFVELPLTENYSLFGDNKKINIKKKSNLPTILKKHNNQY